MRAHKLGNLLYKRDMCDALTAADVQFNPTDPVDKLQELFDEMVAKQEADDEEEREFNLTADFAELNNHAAPYAVTAATLSNNGPAFAALTDAELADEGPAFVAPNDVEFAVKGPAIVALSDAEFADNLPAFAALIDVESAANNSFVEVVSIFSVPNSACSVQKIAKIMPNLQTAADAVADSMQKLKTDQAYEKIAVANHVAHEEIADAIPDLQTAANKFKNSKNEKIARDVNSEMDLLLQRYELLLLRKRVREPDLEDAAASTSENSDTHGTFDANISTAAANATAYPTVSAVATLYDAENAEENKKKPFEIEGKVACEKKHSESTKKIVDAELVESFLNMNSNSIVCVNNDSDLVSLCKQKKPLRSEFKKSAFPVDAAVPDLPAIPAVVVVDAYAANTLRDLAIVASQDAYACDYLAFNDLSAERNGAVHEVRDDFAIQISSLVSNTTATGEFLVMESLQYLLFLFFMIPLQYVKLKSTLLCTKVQIFMKSQLSVKNLLFLTTTLLVMLLLPVMMTIQYMLFKKMVLFIRSQLVMPLQMPLMSLLLPNIQKFMETTSLLKLPLSMMCLPFMKTHLFKPIHCFMPKSTPEVKVRTSIEDENALHGSQITNP